MSQIFFVDDDLELSEKLSNFLKSEGFQVSAVAKRCSSRDNNLTVLDVIRPELNKLQIVQRWLQQSKQVDLPAFNSDDTNALNVGEVQMITSSRGVTVAGNKVELTSTEFNILQVLITEAGKVITKADLSETALGRNLVRYDRSIDMHISNLRSKLAQYADGKIFIKTVRGIGYQYTMTS